VLFRSGLLHPVGRQEPGGLAIDLAGDESSGEHRPARLRLRAPIAPGLLEDVAIAGWQAMPADRAFEVEAREGILALDGEREFPFERGEHVQVTLRERAFPTLDVPRSLQAAARLGLFRAAPAAA
jgi:hypothetical protein